MNVRSFTFCTAILALSAGSASAQSVKLEFNAGRVTLIAQNALPRMVLAEWARLGGTRIVNGDRVPGGPLTLELRGVPERQALDIVLRGVAGYMAGAREVPDSGASAFDRIMILPTSTVPRTTPAPTFATQPPAPQTPQFDDDDHDPDLDAPETPVVPGAPRRVGQPAGQGVAPGVVVNPPFIVRPAAPQTFTPPAQAQPPAKEPAPQPGNPFAPTPVPPQQEGRPANPQQR